MDRLFTEASIDSPSILFDGELGLIEIKGKSLPEDALVCYAPLQSLVKEYVKSPKSKTTINIKLEYLNSSSAKKILEILILLEALLLQSLQVEIRWFYNIDDEDMHDEGEEFKRMTDIPIILQKEQ